MATLSKDAILAKRDCPVHPVEVPEWDNDVVYVRTLSAAEYLNVSTIDSDDPFRLADYAILFLCDEQGKAIFAAEDREALAAKRGKAIERIVTAGLKFNGLVEDAIEAEGNA